MLKCGLNLLLISLTILLCLSPCSADAAVGDFLFKWSAGYGFYYPSDVAVDGSGNVYVADTDKHRIQVFTNTGILITIWGSYGTGDGQFKYPFGITVDAAGNVYVADTYNHRIQVFTSTGTFMGKWGSYGTGDGQFNCPHGIGFDAAGNVYVADTDNNRIQVFEGLIVDSDGDGIPDNQDSCPYEDATGFDADSDGCRDSLGGLITLVNSLINEGVISRQLKTSLLTKVENSQKSATKENFCAAVNELEAFQNQIEAQRGKKISNEAAYLLTAYADNVIAPLLNEVPLGSSC